MTEWIVRFEGTGYSLSEVHPSEESAYTSARVAKRLAEEGHPVPATLRIGSTDVLLHEVGAIAVLTRSGSTGEWVHHARSWWINDPRSDALTPLPPDF